MDSEKATNNDIIINPPLCAYGCGFFGTPSTRNLCSKCYTDFLAKIDSSLLLEPISNRSVSLLFSYSDQSNNNSGNGDLREEKNKKRKRCESCNKKVGLLGFECRCGGIFCGLHRYAEEHSCPFDYKAFGRGVLAKANPPCHCNPHNLNTRI